MDQRQQLFASRLNYLRTKKNITQEKLAEEITALTGDSISSMTISSYEKGHRFPILSTFQAICQYFECSMDFLLGLDELVPIKRNETELVNDDSPLNKPDLLINPKEWKKYNDNPVFVVAPGNAIRSRWGILDYEKNRVVFSDFIYPLTSGVKLYKMKPVESQLIDVSFRQPLTLSKLMNVEDHVWVDMLNTETYIKGQYNGWYRHNENKTCLINEANGLTLPYPGCGLSYNAYTI